ncbi:MAG: Hsp20/alpha crystallin family protein [Chloroflexi bacterium]|nr:MAG: Hsp20/alpha crystallin family protein [Chloroflexota bacterium]
MKKETERRVWAEFQRMHEEMDRLFESLLPGHRLPARRQCVWCPPTDVYETSDAAVVRVEIAGVKEEDFEISFADNVLTIAGVRRNRESEQRAYQQMEIWSGPFRTQAHIPWRVDVDAVEAHYADGFLVVRLPKVGRQVRQVPIRTSEEQ